MFIVISNLISGKCIAAKEQLGEMAKNLCYSSSEQLRNTNVFPTSTT